MVPQGFWFKSKTIKLGMRWLRRAYPFIVSIVIVCGLLTVVIAYANTSGRSEKRSIIISIIPPNMPPIPKKSKKPFHSLYYHATHDSIIAR